MGAATLAGDLATGAWLCWIGFSGSSVSSSRKLKGLTDILTGALLLAMMEEGPKREVPPHALTEENNTIITVRQPSSAAIGRQRLTLCWQTEQ